MKLYSLKGEYLCDLREVLQQDQRERLAIESADLKGKDLSGIVLRKLLFSGGDFDGANLGEAILDDVVFEGTWLCDVRLERAKLSNVEFYDVQAYGANLTGAMLTNVRFVGANLSQSDFRQTRLVGVTFERDSINHASNVSGVDFSEAALSGGEFVGADYDAETLFPRGFDPDRSAGLQLLQGL